VLTLLGVLAGLSLALLVGARLWYPRVLFPAPRLEQVPPDVAVRIGAGALQLVDLPQEEGGPTKALHLPAMSGGRTVVVFHGNGETMFDGVPLADALAARGLGALLVEYRGYGLTHGPPPSEAAILADGEAAIAHLAREGIAGDRLALWGTSLGTGVAAEMARRHRVARLVLVAPFTSIDAMARRVVPLLPVSLVLAHHLDTLGKAPEIVAPTLVVHGDADELVPFAMGEAIAGALPEGRLLRVPGGRHDDVLAAPGVLDAIAEHLGGP
jgi:uncharacterized protein